MSFRSEERVHGGVRPEEMRALGVDPTQVLDLSVNLNPYGPPERVLAAIQRADLTRYPDPTGLSARRAWAEVLERSSDALMVGHGAADLFWALVRAFVVPGDRVVIAEPTFSELRIACASAGAQVERVFASETQGFRMDLSELSQKARGARLVYLCSPNNPTGSCVSIAALSELAATQPSCLFVVDQSFLSMSDSAAELTLPVPRNVIAVRSLTKDFCLPGLRLGLLLAEPELVAQLEAARPTWATSAPALAAIEAAAAELPWVAACYAKLRAEREVLASQLRAHGLHPLPSQTVYQLVEVGDAAAFRARLARLGVLVRDASSFGLPRHVRIAVRTPQDTARLAQALTRMEEGP